MAVTYDYYRIFYYVGKYQSFTRAAKILSNSQPNITRSMNNLEAELRCRLFIRSRKGVTLTPEGEKLYLHVQAAYEHLRAGEAEITAEKNLVSGYLSIGVSEVALHGFLPPVLKRFRCLYPGIRIRITNYSVPQAVSAVQNGIIELAIVTTPTGVVHPLQEILLLPSREVLIAGPAFCGQLTLPLHLRDLADYPFVSLARGTKTFEFYDRLFSGLSLALEADIEVATADKVILMVKNDLGLGFVPQSVAQDAIERGEVFEVPLHEEIPLRHICLVHDKSRPLGTAANVFLKMLREAPAS